MVKKILMICLGNICRSPIAEVVMVQALENAKLDNVVVDSAAIGSWHVGNRADHRALSTLENHGLKSTHIVRQIKKNDFQDFDYIFGMDEDNMSELRRLAPKNSKAELLMLGDFGLEKKNRIIEDPYYERGAAGFETAYQQCVVACAAFVKERLENNLRNQQFTMKILFVCLGNTCRSPMAESVMEHLIQKHQLHNWHTDSAGLRDWNVGREPQGRAQHLLQQHGLKSRHLSRLITSQDFYDFDYILGMDSDNIKELQEMANRLRAQTHCKILLLGSYLGRKEDEIIPDPYFSQGMGGFHSAYLQINESCEAFVKKHRNDNNGS